MKKAQNLLEYILIFMVVVLTAYIFASKFNLTTLKNYAFMGTKSTTDASHIEIEAMTK